MFLIDLQSVGMNFLNIIYFIVALVVLVMVHEFGHFITAKMFNVYVSEFSIGFGPLIFKKKKVSRKAKELIKDYNKAKKKEGK